MRQKKIPMRMCVGCGEMKPKQELLRIVKTPDGETIANAAKTAGRGAYICRNIECLKKAKSSKRLEHTFECRLDDSFYEQLQKEINGSE